VKVKLLINGLNEHALTPTPQEKNNDNNLAIRVRRGVVTFKGNKDPREKIVWVVN